MASRATFLSKQKLELTIRIYRLASQLGGQLYLAGGVVRDIFLGESLETKDLDFVFEGDAIKLARLCAQSFGGQIREYPDFLTAKLINPAEFPAVNEIDFAAARKEFYPAPGSLPVVCMANIKDDLRRRDFSINAMALPVARLLAWHARYEKKGMAGLKAAVIDLFGGLEDLSNRIIRVLHEHSFIDDPTRIFRACRYAARLDGGFESCTAVLIKEAVQRGALDTISHFRKFTELRKICGETAWLAALQLLAQLEVLEKMRLCGPGRTQRVLEGCAKLSGEIRSEGRHTDVFEAVVRLMYYDWPSSGREKHFRSFGFGRKFINKMESVEASGRAPASMAEKAACLDKKEQFMGKGDKRTKRGKIVRGSHGNCRRRKRKKSRSAK